MHDELTKKIEKPRLPIPAARMVLYLRCLALWSAKKSPSGTGMSFKVGVRMCPPLP